MNKKLTRHNRQEMIRREILVKNECLDPVFREAKFRKMRGSPYAFFRGSNHLYWEDFYNDWRFSLFGGKEDTLTWINGDAHIYNYGVYANHYDEAIFGMDDFDDSIIADYQYDLWRMAISIVLDCRNNGRFDYAEQKTALEKFTAAYLQEIANYDADDIHREVLINAKTACGILKDFIERVEKKKSRKKMLKKWTTKIKGSRQFNFDHVKLDKLPENEYHLLSNVLSTYKETLSYDFNDKSEGHFNVKDIARRLWSGTGSLGLDRFYILLEGDQHKNDDDIILDVKALIKPPLYDHMPLEEQRAYNRIYKHEGERYVDAFKALTEHPDKYLGWLEYNKKIFSVREKSPFKADFPTEELKDVDDLYVMSDIWGKLLAIRHERASHRLNQDPYALPKKMKELTGNREKQFQQLVTELSFQYSDCVYQDWENFLSFSNR